MESLKDTRVFLLILFGVIVLVGAIFTVKLIRMTSNRKKQDLNQRNSDFLKSLKNIED